MPIEIADTYSDSPFAQRQTGLLFNLPLPDPDAEQLPEGISLCMIVKNEERFLAECLESVKDVVDEINIVDTGSTDRTVEIARSYGAKLDFREWRKDFAWARNESLAMATRRWTLVLDADEELAAESAALMRALRTTPAATTCIYMNIVNHVDDSSGKGTMSHRLVRCFPTNPTIQYVGVIHEHLTTETGDLTTVLAPLTIIHKGYTAEMLIGRDKDVRNKPLVKRAFEEGSDDPFARFNFGNSAICSGDVDLGCEVLEDVLASTPNPKMYFPLAYVVLGQTYAEHYRDNDRALAKLEEGIERFPQDASLVFSRGQVLAKLGRYDEAHEAYDKVLAMREIMAFSVMTDEEVYEWKIYYARAFAYEKEGKYEEAIAALDEALANKPNARHLLHTKARMCEHLERYYDAEVEYRKVAEADPLQGKVELVNFLLRRRRYAQAIALVENEDSENALLLTRLNIAAAEAMLRQQAGDPLPFLEAALRYSPGDGVAISLLERVFQSRGDTAALERLHTDELKAPMLRSEDYVRRSARLLEMERNADALVVAKRGSEIDPANAELRFNGAMAALRAGDEHFAVDALGRVDDTSSKVFSDASRIRAALLLKLGDVPAAVRALRDWIVVQERRNDAVIDASRVLAAGGARSEARSLLGEYTDGDQRVALELTKLLLEEGDLQAAGAVAERALR